MNCIKPLFISNWNAASSNLDLIQLANYNTGMNGNAFIIITCKVTAHMM